MNAAMSQDQFVHLGAPVLVKPMLAKPRPSKTQPASVSWKRASGAWRSLKAKVVSRFDLEPVEREGVSTTCRLDPDQPGRISFIGSLTSPFCKTCSRLRLSNAGTLRPCLCQTTGVPLRPLLRNGTSDHIVLLT